MEFSIEAQCPGVDSSGPIQPLPMLRIDVSVIGGAHPPLNYAPFWSDLTLFWPFFAGFRALAL